MRPKDLFSIVAQLGAGGHSLKFCCRLLGVAPSGFCRWRSKPPSARDIGRVWLGDLIVWIWEASRRTHGKRRIRAELEDAYGEVVNMKLSPGSCANRASAGFPSAGATGRRAQAGTRPATW